MKRIPLMGAVLILLGALLCPAQVWAAGSGGYRLEVPGAEAQGKGAAFVGEADNPSAVFYNPAGMTQLKGTPQLSVGASYLRPEVDYTDFSGNETQMRRNDFAIPHFYYVNDFGLEKWAFGFGFGSFWGTGTEWAEDSFSKYVATKTELTNEDYMMAIAYKLNDQWSLGAALDYDRSKVSKNKKLIQPGGADGNFQLKGEDDTFAYRLSLMYTPNERHQFGFQYRSPFEQTYEGKIHLNQLNGSGSNYQAIFGGTDYSTAAQADSELPQSLVIGYSYTPNAKWRFNADIEWMDWSHIEQEYLLYPDETDGTRLTVLNTGNPVSRDWEDAISAALGAEYAWNEQLRLRGGYFYHDTPIPNTTFDTALPDSKSHSFNLGFGYDLTSNTTLDMSYTLMLFEHRTVDNNVGSTFGASIDGKYEEIINFVTLSVNQEF